MSNVIIISVITGAGIIFLVYGMANIIRILKKKGEESISLVKSVKSVLGKNIISWISIIFFILFVLIVLLGMTAPYMGL